jgi:hypothetical protein
MILQQIDLSDGDDNKLTDHQRQVVTTAADAHSMGWRVLSMYAALTAHNQMTWICFSPIKDKAGIFFDLGDDLVIVDYASTIYMIVYLFSFFGTSYVLSLASSLSLSLFARLHKHT